MSDDDNKVVHRVNRLGDNYAHDSRGRFVKGVSGNPRGRPEGSVSIASKESVRKLEKEGFDPIEHLIGLMEDAYSADNQELQFKIASRLMEYSYSKMPAQVESKVEANIPMLNVMGMPGDEKDATRDGDDSTEQEDS